MSSEDLRGLKGVAIRVADVLLVWASLVFMLPFAHAFKAPLESLGIPLTFSGGLCGVILVSMVFLSLRVALVSLKVALGLFSLLACLLVLLAVVGRDLDRFIEHVKVNAQPVVNQIGEPFRDTGNGSQPAPEDSTPLPASADKAMQKNGTKSGTGAPTSSAPPKAEQKASPAANQSKIDKALQDSAILDKLGKKAESQK